MNKNFSFWNQNASIKKPWNVTQNTETFQNTFFSLNTLALTLRFGLGGLRYIYFIMKIGSQCIFNAIGEFK